MYCVTFTTRYEDQHRRCARRINDVHVGAWLDECLRVLRDDVGFMNFILPPRFVAAAGRLDKILIVELNPTEAFRS